MTSPTPQQPKPRSYWLWSILGCGLAGYLLADTISAGVRLWYPPQVTPPLHTRQAPPKLANYYQRQARYRLWEAKNLFDPKAKKLDFDARTQHNPNTHPSTRPTSKTAKSRPAHEIRMCRLTMQGLARFARTQRHHSRLLLHKENGDFVGIRMAYIYPGSIFQQLCLQQKDILLSADIDKESTSPFALVKQFEHLQQKLKTNRPRSNKILFHITVRRGGRLITYTYQLEKQVTP